MIVLPIAQRKAKHFLGAIDSEGSPSAMPLDMTIQVLEDARGVFNVPWHQTPFTLDLRTAGEQVEGTLVGAFPVPFLTPFHSDRVREGVLYASKRAAEGWLPGDHFASATILVPLDVTAARELASCLGAELSSMHSGGGGESEGSHVAPRPPPSPLTAEAEHVALVTRMLASGEAVPGKNVQSFRWAPSPCANAFLARHRFMRMGRGISTSGTGTLGLGAIAPLAISRTIPPLPFCVDERGGGLYLGGYDQATNLNVFSRLRIGAVVNATMERECPNFFQDPTKRSVDIRADIAYHRVPIGDTTKDDVKKHMPGVLDFVRAHSAARRPVLVHCRQGISRSVTVVLAYLMLRDGVTLEQAQERLQGYTQHGSKPRPNSGFMRQLREIESDVQARLQREREERAERRRRELEEEEEAERSKREQEEQRRMAGSRRRSMSPFGRVRSPSPATTGVSSPSGSGNGDGDGKGDGHGEASLSSPPNRRRSILAGLAGAAVGPVGAGGGGAH